jgi:hypothetical protein
VNAMRNDIGISLPGSPFGVGWGFVYGYQGSPALPYLSELREIGAGLTKVYLFWQQVEPEKGRYDWQTVDAFINQLKTPEEGLIALFSSSLWAVQRPAALLPPSPARDLDDYYRFVYDLVYHCQGRVRYWQNDAEPNNPIFWAGSKEAYVTQLKVFYQAVKDADPNAVVVLGGYDGLFNPPGMPPMMNQQAGLDFFDFVLRESAGAFDLFDLRLYNNPYAIPGCVEYMRQRMREFGLEKPVISTEYGGPAFFAYAENRQYIPLIASWAKSGMDTNPEGLPGEDKTGKNQIEALYQNMPALAPQTQMFMQDCPPEQQAKYERIQARELVTRTILALSAGVQKLIYWQFAAGKGPRDDLMDLMYGKIGMLEFDEGRAEKWRPIAAVYQQMTKQLAGVTQVTRIPCPDQPSIFLFQVNCVERAPVLVAWEQRDPFSGEDIPSVQVQIPWEGNRASAVDILGNIVPLEEREGAIILSVNDTPVYVEHSSFYR